MPSLVELLAPLRPYFRSETFSTLLSVLQAWTVALGPRSLADVWRCCGHARLRWYTFYRFFSAAKGHADDLGLLLLALLLTELLPRDVVWLAVDDTLCHKRGKRVAFGGIFLDPVLSSKSRKVLRFGVERALPLAFVVLSLTVLWYARYGQALPLVRPDSPWDHSPPLLSFSAMLGTFRLALWRHRLFHQMGAHQPDSHLLDFLLRTLATAR